MHAINRPFNLPGEKTLADFEAVANYRFVIASRKAPPQISRNTCR